MRGHIEDKSEWHRWFAWYWVWVSETEWVWLETVYRQCDIDGNFWRYKAIPKYPENHI